MKCLIVLAFAALAHASPIYSTESHEILRSYAPYHYPYLRYSSYSPYVTAEGYIADTPAVAAAKAAHFAAKAKAAAYPYHYPYYRSYPYNSYPYYSYPYSVPLVTPEGYLSDAPSVAAAKAAYYAVLGKSFYKR